jgi:hypothetical protein
MRRGIRSKAAAAAVAISIAVGTLAIAVPALASAGARARGSQARPAGKPGAPRSVTAVPINTGAQLTWRRPASDGGARITGYVIRATPGGKVAKTTNVTSFTVGGLRDGTSYRFTVTAVNRRGAGPASRRSTAVTPRRPVAPSAPRNVTASAGHQSATVRWTAPASDGGAPITRYTIAVSPGHATATLPGDARKAIVTGLSDGVGYAVTVTAINGAGTSRAGAARVTPTVTVPSAPTSVRVASAGSGAAAIQWNPPADDGGSPLTGYTVSVSDGGPSLTLGPSATSTTISGLDPGKWYQVSVTAENGHGYGATATSSPVTPNAKATAGTVVLDAAALASLTSVLTDGALTFANPPAQVTGLRPGEVIAAGATKETPAGLLREVDGVSSHHGITTVTTSPAALNQAIRTGDLAFGGALGAANVASFAPAGPGIRLLRLSAASRAGIGIGLGASIGISINADLYKATDDRTVHAEGSISLTPAVDLSVSLSGGHIDAAYQATVTEASSVELKAQLSHEFSASIPLGEITFDPIVFMVGPVPVVLVPKFSLDLSADGTITVGALTSASQSVTYGVSLASTDGRVTTTTINQHTSSFSPPTLFDSLDLSIGPEAELSLLLYGVVGPYVKDELTIANLHASTTEDPWWTLSAENVMSAGFKLSALGDDIADWSKSPLIDSTWPLANAGGPFMGVLISPNPASVAPGGSLKLSARVQRSPSQAVTWSVQPHGGTISADGRYTAPDKAGYYQVIATSPASGLKPATSGVVVVRVGAQPPGAPTRVTAVPAGPGKATLSWAKPADTGGSDIRSYQVTSFPPGAVAFAGGNDTSAVVTGLTPGGTYQFTLAAVNAVGPGPASAVTAPITIPNVDPYATSAWPSYQGQLNGDPANPGETILSTATAGAVHRTWVSAPMSASTEQPGYPPVVSDGFAYVALGAKLAVFNTKTGALAYKITLPYATTWNDVVAPGNDRVYLVTDGSGAPLYGAIVAVDLATRHVLWKDAGKPCALPEGGTFADGVLVATGGDTCGINASTGAILWHFSFPSPDASFGAVTDGSIVYMTRQSILGDGQDFWLLGINPVTGAASINRFFNTAGGGLMMAGGKLVLSAITIQGNPAPALFGIDPATGQTDWTYTNGDRVGAATTDGSTIWVNECGKIVKLDASNGVVFDTVASRAIPCLGPAMLAGDLFWTESYGPKPDQVTAIALSAADLAKVATVPLSLPANGQDSAQVIADGHLFLLQQVSSAQWRLATWGL